MHATVLRSIRNVQRLAGSPCTSCSLIETVYRVLQLKYKVFTIPNMFELIHTKGVMKIYKMLWKIYKMLRKKATYSLRVTTLYYLHH